MGGYFVPPDVKQYVPLDYHNAFTTSSKLDYPASKVTENDTWTNPTTTSHTASMTRGAKDKQTTNAKAFYL